ncbi:capsid cement protein [Photobacterium swingsii]|uniref:capsid cement protein n=1 Tax=Photobacterium swingsii TaxID=680026 RepID=UPI00352ECA4B
MRIADGNKIDIIAPAGGVTKDVPLKHGSLIVVPNMSAPEGQVVSATYRGLFDGPIKAGDSLSFIGEPAYFADSEFTKTKPGSGVTVPVGVFVDGCVLLTGVLM